MIRIWKGLKTILPITTYKCIKLIKVSVKICFSLVLYITKFYIYLLIMCFKKKKNKIYQNNQMTCKNGTEKQI